MCAARNHDGFLHLREMRQADEAGFLAVLATEKQVARATHCQALNALLFPYRQVLGTDLPSLQQIGRPRERNRRSVVLTVQDSQTLLSHMVGAEALLAALLHVSGLRLREALGSRVKHVYFDRHTIVVRSDKCGKDGLVILARTLAPRLRAPLTQVSAAWGQDRVTGRGGVYLPNALERKHPRSSESWT